MTITIRSEQTADLEELHGPTGFTEALACATSTLGGVLAELVGPGWTHVLFFDVLAPGSLSVTDLDSGDHCFAPTSHAVRDLGSYVTSSVVVRR